MKKIFKIILIFSAIVILGFSAAFVLIYGPSFGIYLKKPSPQEYVSQAVKYMDNLGIYSSSDEWAVVRDETLRKAAKINSYEEAYPIIEKALKTVGGKHSRLITPDELSETPEEAAVEWIIGYNKRR